MGIGDGCLIGCASFNMRDKEIGTKNQELFGNCQLITDNYPVPRISHPGNPTPVSSNS